MFALNIKLLFIIPHKCWTRTRTWNANHEICSDLPRTVATYSGDSPRTWYGSTSASFLINNSTISSWSARELNVKLVDYQLFLYFLLLLSSLSVMVAQKISEIFRKTFVTLNHLPFLTAKVSGVSNKVSFALRFALLFISDSITFTWPGIVY